MALDRDQVEKTIRKLRKMLKKMAAEPTPKQVHSFRTNSRRLEALLPATNADKNGRKIAKQISKLRKRAGKVRDMDVLTAYATELPRAGGEEDCSVRLLEHLGTIRGKHAKKVSTAAQKRAPNLRRRLKRASNTLQKKTARPNAERVETSSQATSAALRALAELAQPRTLNRSNLHPYRLKVKELQNLLRLAPNGGDRDFVESLGEVKDAIGEWHDWVQLQSIAQEVLEHPQCRLIRELKRGSEERFARALKLAEQMRKKHLGKTAGKQSRKGNAPRPSESVWSATAALAA